MSTYSKATLLQMNADPKYGYNWIKNLENINDNQQVVLYPTGFGSLYTGNMYVALPSTLILTDYIRSKYNLSL